MNLFIAIRTFLLRILISTMLVAAFFVVTQDFQIFPGTIPGLLAFTKGDKGQPRTDLPEGIEASFIQTIDGANLETWFMQANPVTAETNQPPVAIIFHGNAETVQSTYQIQEWFRRGGISSVSFDYRGYGRSTGWPSEAGLYMDAEAVKDFVNKKFAEHSIKIIYFGVSVGTGYASYLASKQQPEILCLLSPYTNFRTLVADMHLIGYLAPFLKYEVPTQNYLAMLQKTQVLIFHGRNDQTIPALHSEQLQSVFLDRPNFKVEIVAGLGHNDLLGATRHRIMDELQSALVSSK